MTAADAAEQHRADAEHRARLALRPFFDRLPPTYADGTADRAAEAVVAALVADARVALGLGLAAAHRACKTDTSAPEAQR